MSRPALEVLRGGPLQRPSFRRLFAAVGASQIGDWLYYAAFIVYLYERSGSALAVGTWMVARQVAYIAIGPVATAVAERFAPKRWLQGINLAKVAVMAAIVATIALDAPVWLAIVLAFASSALTSGYVPVLLATVPDVVPEPDLAQANALIASTEKAAMVIGPVLGAVALAVTGGPAAAVALNAVSFAIAAWCLAGIAWPGASPARRATSHLRGDLVEGLRALGASVDASIIAALTLAALATFGAEQVLYVQIASERLGTGSHGVTTLLAAYGVGGLLGAVPAARLASRSRTVPVMVGAFATLVLPLAVLTVVDQPVAAYAVVALGGAAFLVFQVIAATVLQRVVPAPMLARVWAILLSVGYLGTLLGSWAGSRLAADRLEAAMVVPLALGLAVLAATAVPLLRLDRRATAEALRLRPLVDVLGQVPIFASAPQLALERIAGSVREEHLAKGSRPIVLGDDPDDLYLVRSGHFDVHAGVDAEAPRINALGPGGWFGEIGIIEHRPRTATVVAVDDAVVWRIPGATFQDALAHGDGLPGPLQASIARRLARSEAAATAPDDPGGSRPAPAPR